MKRKKISKEDVIKANRDFYNISSDFYEEVDGRRDSDVHRWMRNTLKVLQDKSDSGRILDIGCGSGFVMRCAEGLYDEIHGVDISENILIPLGKKFNSAVCSDVSALPFKDDTFDVITCFAALHHIYEHKSLMQEVRRVLKPGGVFYSDHDMERLFMTLFYIPMFFYRMINDMSRRYMEKSNQITREMYNTTEIHSSGISAKKLKRELFSAGFTSVTMKYHWYGLSPVFSKIMGKRGYPRGLAPVFSIQAM